jgi:nucleoside-diphosphate-sugar epimerase
MKVLVTGASGFVGGAVAMHLSQNTGMEITATGRSARPAHLMADSIVYMQMDLCSMETKLNYDVCIHCAGLADDRSSRRLLMESNVVATKNLLEKLSGCSTFVFISSASVYDFKKFPRAKETDAGRSDEISVYGQTKLEAEEFVRKSGIQSVYILRPRAVYGRGDRILYPRIMSRLKSNYFIVPGNLKVASSLTNIRNLVDSIENSISHSKQGVFTFNVADSKSYLLRDVFRSLGEEKTEAIRFVALPVGLIRSVVRICDLLRIPIPFSQQSIAYITMPSELDTKSICETLQTDLSHNLDDFLNEEARN